MTEEPDTTGGPDGPVSPDRSEEVPAPAWARFLLVATPFLVGALVLLVLSLLAS